MDSMDGLWESCACFSTKACRACTCGMDGISCVGVFAVRSRIGRSMPRMVDGSAARGAHVPVCLICRMFGAFSSDGSGGKSPRSSVSVDFSRMRGGSYSGRSSARRISDFSVRKSSHADVFSAWDFFACRTYERRPCSCAVGAGALCDFCCSGRVRTFSVRGRGDFSVGGTSDTDGQSGSDSRTDAFAVSFAVF